MFHKFPYKPTQIQEVKNVHPDIGAMVEIYLEENNMAFYKMGIYIF